MNEEEKAKFIEEVNEKFNRYLFHNTTVRDCHTVGRIQGLSQVDMLRWMVVSLAKMEEDYRAREFKRLAEEGIPNAERLLGN